MHTIVNCARNAFQICRTTRTMRTWVVGARRDALRKNLKNHDGNTRILAGYIPRGMFRISGDY